MTAKLKVSARFERRNVEKNNDVLIIATKNIKSHRKTVYISLKNTSLGTIVGKTKTPIRTPRLEQATRINAVMTWRTYLPSTNFHRLIGFDKIMSMVLSSISFGISCAAFIMKQKPK